MKLRVLVVDDDEDLLYIAEQILHIQEEELELVKATTAQAAVQFLDEGNLDAVICDFHLGPDQMNGLEILEWVRDEGIDIPFIIFTGHSREEIAIKALNLGADYYIEKGDDLEGLFTEIGYHIRKVVRNKRTEEALHDSEQRLRTLVQSLNDLIFVVDSENRFSQYHSVSREELFEPPDKFIGKHISEIFPPSIAGTYVKLVQEVRASGERLSFDYELKTDGERRWYTADLDLHEDKESIVVTVAEISKRKQAELDLRNAERAWRNTFDSIPDIVTVLNNEFEIIKANKTMSDFLGIPSEELIGKKCYELMHRASEPFSGCPHLETIKTGMPASAEITDTCMGKPYLVTTSPIQDDQGEQVGVVHIAKDISERLEAERTIKESESQFRAIFEEAGIGMALVRNGHILEGNSAFVRLLGYDENEIKELTIEDITHPDDRGEDSAALQDLIASDKESYNLEKRYIRKDGEIVWGKLTVTLIPDPVGTQDYVIGMVEDITERKKTEILLNEERDRAKTYLNLAGTMILATDTNLDITMINDTGCTILGLAEEEILGKNWIETFIPEQEQERIRNYMLGIMSGQVEPSKTDEGPVIEVSGNVRWIQWSDVVVRGHEGQVVGILSAGPDITEKKKAEEELQTSEEKFRAMFESAGIGMTIVGVDDQIINANTVYQDLVGFNIDELRKMTIADFTHPDDVQTDARMFEEVSSGERDSYQMEKRYIRKNGEMIWVHLTVTVVKDEHDEITFIFGMVEDITARKEAESALGKSEHKYRTLLENVQSGIQITQDGIIVFSNEILAGMIGYTIDEIVGTPFLNLIAPEDQEWIITRYRKRLAGEEVPSEYDVRVLHKNGSLKQVRLKIANFEFEGKLSTIATIMDVTERSQAVDELRESEHRYRLLFENLSDGLFITNSEGIITMCSPQGARLFGETPDEIIGTHFSSSMHPDDRERLINEFRRGFENKETQPSGHEVRGIRQDGSEFVYHITNTLLIENGEPVGYQSLIRDITEIKEIEIDLRNSELRYRQIIESTPMGMHMYELDENDRLIFIGANSAADKLLGLDHTQFIGKSLEEAFPSATETELPQVYREVALKGVPWSSEQINYADDKISGAFEVHAFQTMPRKMVASFLDITERKVAEQAIANSRENFQTVFETIDDLVFIIGLDAKIITTNHSVRDLLGYSEEELHGLDVLTVHPPDRREEAADILKEMIKGETTICPVPLMAKDGTIIPVETRITPGRWSGEDVLVGVSRDITESINSEILLKKTTHDLGERMKELTCLYQTTSVLRNPDISTSDAIQAIVKLIPPGWQYPEVTCAKITINGEDYSTSNFKQSKWKQTADIKVFKEKIGAIQVYYTEERPDHFEGPFLKEERDLIDTLAKYVCEYIERRISEKALQENEDRYRSLVENIPVVSWTSNANGETTFISPNVEEIYGYTPEEICKAGEELWFNRIHPDDVERVKQAYARVFDPNEEFNIEYRIKTKDGNWIWLLDWSTQTYEKNGERLAAGVFMNITQRKRMQDILKESEEKAQRYLDIIGSMILTIDNEGIVTSINRMGCEILGYNADEIIGLKWIDHFIPQRFRAEVQEVHSKAMSEKITEVEEFENLITTKSGEERLLAWRNVALLDNDGNIIGAISSAVDITDRNKAEIKLKNEMEFTETALNSQHDTFFVFNPSTGKAIRWNKTFQQITEYSDEEIASMKAPDSYYDSDDLERANDAIQNLMTEGIATLELRLITKSGKRIPFEYEASLMKDNGNNEFIVSVGRDITDRKYALEEVRKSEARYKALFDSTNDAIFLIDLDGVHTEVNEQGARMLGYDREELIGNLMLENIAPVDHEDANEKLTKLLAGESFPVYERTLLKKDGTEMLVEVNVALVTDSEGQPHHLQSVVRDISERKHAEEALEKQLDFLENVLESLSHPFYVIDAKDYTIKLANKVARIGILEENPTCHYVTHRSITPCSQSEHPCPLEEVKRTKKPVIVEHEHYDDEGNIRDMEIHAHPIFGDDGNVIQMIEYSLDITDFKKTMRALEEGEKRFRILYENAPLGYQTLNENGYVVDINSAWLDGTGYQRDEVVGHYFGEFLSEESEQLFEDSFPVFKSTGEISNIEYEMVRKDGSKLIGRFSGRTTNDESGKFKQTACIFQDVTDWKVSDELLRKQKKELSELAHVMSHDLGNKMQNIRSLVSIGESKPEEVLQRIDNIAQQSSELLQASADLADAGMIIEKRERVDLNKIVRNIAKTTLPETITFQCDDLPTVFGSPEKIGQIFQNLFNNAVEHGNPTVVEVRKGVVDLRPTIIVKNNGSPIPNEIRSKIFTRGFTTKKRGSGLGLSIVKKLVDAHDWRISLDPGVQTSFSIILESKWE